MVQEMTAYKALEISSMSCQWPKSDSKILDDVNMELPKGCRCILSGSNGAGKSCLLRAIVGINRYEGNIKIFGEDSLRPSLSGSFNTEIVAGINVWRNNDCILVGERWQPSGDARVSTMLGFVDGWSQERCDYLVERFGVDLDWRVNQLSDGRKRRVQLLMSFLIPSRLVLLDEVTTDLDVLARQTLLDFVREESEERGVSIIMSTHIFDGLEDWGTHLALVSSGSLKFCSTMCDVDGLHRLQAAGDLTPLFSFVEASLRSERRRWSYPDSLPCRNVGGVPLHVN